MSYCRWSSDDWKCDVYVYQSSVGYETHVASRRLVNVENIPTVNWASRDFDEISEQYSAQVAWMKDAGYEPIGLPYDGQSYVDATPGDCAKSLIDLREAGYCVPQYAIDALLEEAKEASNG